MAAFGKPPADLSVAVGSRQRSQELDNRALLVCAERSKISLRGKRLAEMVQDGFPNGGELAVMEIVGLAPAAHNLLVRNFGLPSKNDSEPAAAF